jgi:hypothetical protein
MVGGDPATKLPPIRLPIADAVKINVKSCYKELLVLPKPTGDYIKIASALSAK